MSSQSITTRERILNASWQALESKDGAAVRMTDIAKLAGISRQALYLHFKTRAELLIATTRYIDEVKAVDKRLAESRTASGGVHRLESFIEAWGNYIPEIYGIGKALMAMKDSDAEAAAAWDDRMQAVREGCLAAVRALAADDQLTATFSEDDAVDILWMLLSVRNWEQLTLESEWPQDQYVAIITELAKKTLVK